MLNKIHSPGWVTLGLCGSSPSARDAADYAGVNSGADTTPLLVCGVLAISTSANEIQRRMTISRDLYQLARYEPRYPAGMLSPARWPSHQMARRWTASHIP